MALTPEQILTELRALRPAERLRVVERVVREVADEVTPEPPAVDGSDAIWASESDTEFDAFQCAINQLRAADVWRTGDGEEPR